MWWEKVKCWKWSVDTDRIIFHTMRINISVSAEPIRQIHIPVKSMRIDLRLFVRQTFLHLHVGENIHSKLFFFNLIKHVFPRFTLKFIIRSVFYQNRYFYPCATYKWSLNYIIFLQHYSRRHILSRTKQPGIWILDTQPPVRTILLKSCQNLN